MASDQYIGPYYVMWCFYTGNLVIYSTTDRHIRQSGRDAIPLNTRRSSNVCLLLGQRRRRWPNIKQTLDERFAITRMERENAVVQKYRSVHF